MENLSFYIRKEKDKQLDILSCVQKNEDILEISVQTQEYNKDVIVFAKIFCTPCYKETDEVSYKVVYVTRRNIESDDWIVVKDIESVYYQLINNILSSNLFYIGNRFWYSILDMVTFIKKLDETKVLEVMTKNKIKIDDFVGRYIVSYLKDVNFKDYTETDVEIKEHIKKEILTIVKSHIDKYLRITEQNKAIKNRKRIYENLQNFYPILVKHINNTYDKVYDDFTK